MIMQVDININQMRLITRNCYPVHIWNVSEYIKQTQANIIKQDTHRFITIQNIFKKLYLRHLRDHQQVEAHVGHLNDFAAISQSPARAIADYFHKKGKTYSEGFMTATFEHIGKAYQISKSDNAGSLDTLGYKLFLSSEFGNLSEQLKYGLRNNKVGFDNLVTIIQSLIKLEYVDHEIVNMLLLYTERQIKCTDQYAPLSDWPGDRHYQIEKKNYYNPQDDALLEGLRGSSEVNTAISFVRHIYQEWEKEDKQTQYLKKQNINELNELINSIGDTNKNFRKIVEGIINIRRQYLRMVQFSENEQILRNPNLNFELLSLEEKLLSLKLLNIQDIKNTKKISNSQYEVRRVQEILLLYLNVQNLSPIFSYIDRSPVEVEPYSDNTHPDTAKIAKLLNLLSRIASLDRFVYHTADGRSLINLKWEKTLLETTNGPYVPNQPYNQQLNISRIFRRVYSDILDLINRNQQRVSDLMKVSSTSDRILFLDALCRMGLQEKAIVEANLFESNHNAVDISGLDSEAFETLVHLFNDIGIFINNDKLKEQIYNRLAQNLILEENNRLVVGLRQTIDIVNYLLQNHKEKPSFKDVYDRYLKILEAKSIYLTPEEHQNELTVEAFKILALEKPEEYGSHPVYLNFIYRFVHDSFKKNPYFSYLREACYKLSKKDSLLNKMQTHLTLGVRYGLENGLVFSNSDETSLDGQIRSGDLNSYIIRLSSKHNMLVHQFSINSLLQIDYSNQKNSFKLKPMARLIEKIEEVFERQTKRYDQAYDWIQESMIQFLSVYPDCLIANKIRLKLAAIQQLRNNSSNHQTKEQQYTNNALFFIEVLELNKLIRLLQEGSILSEISKREDQVITINTKLDPGLKESQSSKIIKVDVNRYKGILREIKSRFFELIEILSATLKEQLTLPAQASSNIGLKGERQTIEVISSGSQSVIEDLSAELLNHRYFNDKTFCEYQDWKQRIQNRYNLEELNLEEVSNLSKILVNKFCPEITNKLSLLPICKHSERLKRLNLEFKLLKDNYSQTTEQPPPTLVASEIKDLDYIINLQIFKHELKTTFNAKSIVDYIFGFKFITDIKKDQVDTSKILLHRNPQEYFNYLEELHQRNYIESPYAKYIISKLSKTDKIRDLLEKRKEIRIAERINYQKGLITASTYYEKVGLVEDELLAAVETLKTKMLDDMDDTILSGQLKMLDIKKDQLQAFEYIIRRNYSYSRQFDTDFIYANGNYEKAIDLKRGRAQNNYIKLYLLKKLGENKLLNAKQSQLLKEWHEDILKSVSQTVVYDKYTTMLISELPWQDLQSLKLKSSALNSNKDMLLIDLIMEFNLFLNDSLINAYERRVKANYFEQKYHIPRFMFDQSNSYGFKQIENQVERSLIREHSKLKPEDIDTMEEIFKIFKTEGFKERNRYQVLCKRFKENLTHMNTQIIGPELILEYIRIMEDEFMKQFDPSLVAEIKTKQTDKLWREIFHHPYDNCSKQLLKDITKKLILRMELMTEKTPPFFGDLILSLLMHPNLDSLTKQTVIAAIEVNKIELNLDSSHIEMLSNLPGREIASSKQLKKELAILSSTKLGDLLYSRAKESL